MGVHFRDLRKYSPEVWQEALWQIWTMSSKTLWAELASFNREVNNPLQYCCLENPIDRAVWWGHLESDTTQQTGLSN